MLEILDEDIGTSSQFMGQSQVCRIIEIEHNRALVAVNSQVVSPHPIALRWYPTPGIIPCRALDLNHRCTEVTKQHRAIRASQYPREVGDQQAVKRAKSLVGSLHGFLVVLLWHKGSRLRSMVVSNREEVCSYTIRCVQRHFALLLVPCG